MLMVKSEATGQMEPCTNMTAYLAKYGIEPIANIDIVDCFDCFLSTVSEDGELIVQCNYDADGNIVGIDRGTEDNVDDTLTHPVVKHLLSARKQRAKKQSASKWEMEKTTRENRIQEMMIRAESEEPLFD